MAQVSVTVAGRIYRMACGEGEEKHIEALAAAFDGKIAEFKGTIGDIGEMRLHVMAGLFFADEASEMRKRLAAIEEKIAALLSAQKAAGADAAKREVVLATALDEAARRIEGMTRQFATQAREA